MTTQIPTPSIAEIEEFLLGLVARDRGMTVEQVRAENEQYPHDPPWSSEVFVHYQEEIESFYRIDFDAEEVEKVQRDVGKLARHIQDLIAHTQAQTA